MTYKDAGVDVGAAERFVRRIRPIALRTARPGLREGIGGFAALFDLPLRRYRRPVLVSSTDGVGTKLKVAFLAGVHDTVGIDLVAMSVNDILTRGAEPLFFLDYFVCGKLDEELATAVVRGIAEGCRQAGCVLIGGETAEHPGDFPDGQYDLAGFAVGVVERGGVPDPARIAPGDVLIGLPSSGLHSNGYSLARKVLLERGRLRLSQRSAELGRTLGEELLAPTRIYVKLLLPLFRAGLVKGAAHITGGGIPGNLPRVLPPRAQARVRRGSWPVPPIFGMIQRLGSIPQPEMDRTFNNGLGMVLVAGPGECDRLQRALRRRGERPYVIGEIVRGERGVAFTS